MKHKQAHRYDDIPAIGRTTMIGQIITDIFDTRQGNAAYHSVYQLLLLIGELY
jgi:hypothetical protein